MPSNNPQPSLREQVDSIIDRELNNEDGLDSVSELLQLFESTMLEVIKVPPCNCKHARHIVGEQRTRLSALLGKEGTE